MGSREGPCSSHLWQSFSLVGLALAVYALRRRDRHWPVWAGLVASGLTVAFWLYFFIANIVAPA